MLSHFTLHYGFEAEPAARWMQMCHSHPDRDEEAGRCWAGIIRDRAEPMMLHVNSGRHTSRMPTIIFLHILDVSNSQYCISKTARFHIPEDDRRMNKTLFGNSSHQNENSVIYSPSSCSDPLWISYFCWTQKKIFWRILTKPLPVAIDFHTMENKTKKILWKSMASGNCFIVGGTIPLI